MSNIRAVSIRLILILAVTGLAVLAISAQLTVINTPSTDTLQAKSFYLEFDFGAKLKSYSRGGYQSYGYRTVYGIDRKTEAGVTLFYTRAGASRPVEAQFSLKRKIYQNEKYGLAAAAGVTAYSPLNSAAGGKTFAMIYGNFSKVLARARGLRLTAGAYHIVNGGRDFGTKTGVMLAFEQPLYKRVSLIGDWSSGHNRFGYAAPGLSFALTKKQNFTVSYNFGNTPGDNSLFVFYSYTF